MPLKQIILDRGPHILYVNVFFLCKKTLLTSVFTQGIYLQNVMTPFKIYCT